MEADDYADPAAIDAPPGPGVELVVLVMVVAGAISGLAWVVYKLLN